MQRTALVILSFLMSLTTIAQVKTINGPTNSGSYGYSVTTLRNGNYVVTDPWYDNGAATAAGAVYLYNGSTHALISTLRGSHTNDHVGNWGVVPLINGNFVVISLNWTNGSASDAGAVTWGSGTTGVSGVVSASNSLVSSGANSLVGQGGVIPLPNGNYVVVSSYWYGAGQDFGAVTWGNGFSGTSGVISASNSIVGSSYYDRVGNGGITILANGNYVVVSSNWNNGRGAATWCNGSAGTAGVVSASNSLVGSTANDYVADSGVVALANGNYVVRSTSWANGITGLAGAATWGSGTAGISGAVSVSNSLVGTHPSDRVGSCGVIALPNGNYVVNSCAFASNGQFIAGAVTWANGSTGMTGTISPANSLVGDSSGSMVGSGGVTVLTNGNFVVNSPSWKYSKGADAGAVTWCSASAGRVGSISQTNSLIGDTMAQQVGYGGVTALSNGNYAVCSPHWSYAAIGLSAGGAVTWGNGTTGTTGLVAPTNSLLGKTGYAMVGEGGAVALTNGNFVVCSPSWRDSAHVFIGAVTWCDGTKATSGRVTDSNSLVGATNFDQVGSFGVIPLTNGNYVVNSPTWTNVSAPNAGAVTWCSGTGATAAKVSAFNSLVGSTADDKFGLTSVKALSDGNYIAGSMYWDNGSIADAGAVSWGNGTNGTSGLVSAANALVGTQTEDWIGLFIDPLPNGNYAVHSPLWDNGSKAQAGAVTWGRANGGTHGVITTCNSVVGMGPGSGSMGEAYDSLTHSLIVGIPAENKHAIYQEGSNNIAASASSVTQNVIIGYSTHFVDTSCQLIASVKPSGSNPLTGSAKASVNVQSTAPSYSGQAYVRRYYDIQPAVNPNSASARVTLYYTQPDFDDYNLNNGADPDMPSGPTDMTGIAALRFTLQHGTSSSGLPGTFSGWAGSGPASVVIDPDDSNIVWNTSENRWEVSFNVIGFSGFFSHTGNMLTVPGTIQRHDLSLSPVPASSYIDISTENPKLIGSNAIISDIQGKPVLRITIGATTRVDLRNLPEGIYWMKVETGDVFKIIKK